MKSVKLKSLYFLIAAALVVFVANSCRKDIHSSEQQIEPERLVDAKSWYQATYPFKGGKKVNDVNGDIDFSQIIQPDWDNANTYERFGDEVMELPADASGAIGANLAGNIDDSLNMKKEYSKNSFLLLKNNGTYKAYIMTIIADPDYIANNLSRLDSNKYNKRDSNFTGAVLYSTPNGQFVNGWVYKNGNIIRRLRPDPVSGSAVNKSKTTHRLRVDTYTTAITYCTDWYQMKEGRWVYLDTQCHTIYGTVYDDGGGGGASGGGGGGGSSGGGSSGPGAPQTTPCDPSIPASIANKIGGLKTHGNAPANPGTTPGFPPPAAPQPCDEEISLEEELAEELAEDPTFLLDCKIVAAFKALATYKTPTAVNVRMDKLNDASKRDKSLFWDPFYVQQVKNAFGYQINLDRFEINVKKLPKINGKSATAPQLLDHIRRNLNNFIDKSIATFEPYVDKSYNIDDSKTWTSSNPLGSILHLEMDDMGSVIVSDYASDHWTVSTLRTPLDNLHPVSGNRSWGFVSNTDGTYTFYVTGADRLTATYHQLVQAMTNIPFSEADKLWGSYQKSLSNFINNNQGVASVGNSIKERPDYAAVRDYLDGKITIEQLKSKGGCK